MQAVEISGAAALPGDVLIVRVLGAFATVTDTAPDAISWKLVTCALSDFHNQQQMEHESGDIGEQGEWLRVCGEIKDAQELEAKAPGVVDSVRYWLQSCDQIHPGDSPVSFELSGQLAPPRTALNAARNAAQAWGVMTADGRAVRPVHVAFSRAGGMLPTHRADVEKIWEASYLENLSLASISLTCPEKILGVSDTAGSRETTTADSSLQSSSRLPPASALPPSRRSYPSLSSSSAVSSHHRFNLSPPTSSFHTAAFIMEQPVTHSTTQNTPRTPTARHSHKHQLMAKLFSKLPNTHSGQEKENPRRRQQQQEASAQFQESRFVSLPQEESFLSSSQPPRSSHIPTSNPRPSQVFPHPQGSQGGKSRGVGAAGDERILAASSQEGFTVPAAAPSSLNVVAPALTAGETGGNQTAAGNHAVVAETPSSVLPFLGFSRSSLHAPKFLRPPKLLSLSLMPGGGGAAGKDGRGKEGRSTEEEGKEERRGKEEAVKQKQKGKGKRVGFGAVECVAGPPAAALSGMWREEERWEELERGEEEREEEGGRGKENRGNMEGEVRWSSMELAAGIKSAAGLGETAYRAGDASIRGTEAVADPGAGEGLLAPTVEDAGLEERFEAGRLKKQMACELEAALAKQEIIMKKQEMLIKEGKKREERARKEKQRREERMKRREERAGGKDGERVWREVGREGEREVEREEEGEGEGQREGEREVEEIEEEGEGEGEGGMELHQSRERQMVWRQVEDLMMRNVPMSQGLYECLYQHF
ncbi:unnamed protein product [Closterium sp. Yama58-4]|nr:unnamed protein product [Closterium sp. Yama58-4]